MKTKTIQKILVSKMTKWLDSITSQYVRTLAEENLIVTGGSIASMLLNEKVNDFDIYFKTKEACMAVAEYYASEYITNIEVIDGANTITHTLEAKEKLEAEDYSYDNIFYCNLDSSRVKLYINNHTGFFNPYNTSIDNENDLVDDVVGEGEEKEIDIPKYTPIYFTENAITLSNQVQLVIRFWGNPDEIHKNYDFVHATNYFTMKEGLVLNKRALTSILTKELKYVGSKYPLTSIIRTKKFVNRGFTIGAGEYLKIMWQLNELDLKNPAVLQEQLTGVDVAYFSLLIEAMSNVKDKSNLTYDYLVKIIDKIFG